MPRSLLPPAPRRLSSAAERAENCFTRALPAAGSTGILLLLFALGVAFASADEESAASPPEQALDDEFSLVAEPTVTAASRHDQRLSEAPSSVTVITYDEIQRFGYTSLADLLDATRSFYLSNDRNYTYVGVRGFGSPGDYNDRVLFLLDGHPVNENVYDSTIAIGPEIGVDLDAVERVEIIRGPGSALYGSNALFAVVNVVTRSGAKLDGLQPAVLGGNHGRYGSSLNWGDRTPGGFDYRISGSFHDTRGEDLYFEEFDAPASNGGVAEDLDRDRSHQVSFRASYGSWSLQGYHSSREKQVPTASWGTEFNHDDYFTRDTATFLDVKHERRLTRSLEVTARGYLDVYEYHGLYPWEDPPGTVINDDSAEAQWVGEEVLLAWQSRAAHRLMVGQGMEWTYQAQLRNFDRDPFFEYADVDETFLQYWAHILDEWKPGGGLTFSLGARLDHHESFGFNLSPRLAVLKDVGGDSTVKVLLGTAYRAPNVYEWRYADGSSIAPANDLDPEQLISYEVAYEHRLPGAGAVAFSIFRNHVDDLIALAQLGGGLGRYENIETATTQGVEAEGRLSFPSGFVAYGSATYTHAEDGEGERLTNSPRASIKSGISFGIGGGVYVSPEYQFAGSRKTLTGDSTPALRLAHLTLLWRLEGETSISLSARNLLDDENFVPGSVEHVQDQIIQPGRSYFLKLRTSF